MRKGDSIFIRLKSGDTSVDFKHVMDAYNTAALVYPEMADAARDSMMEVFTYIEKVKNDAIVQRIRANTATEQARKERDIAEFAKRVADTLKQLSIAFNFSNAPYKYLRLIRDGPKDKAKISNDTFDLKLIAYCNHLDSLRDSIKQYCAKSDVYIYNSLHENLYYDNDLYEKIYYCFKSHDSIGYVLNPDQQQDTGYFSENSIRKRSEGFMLSDDSTKITSMRSNQENEILQRAGQKFTSFTLSHKSKLIFCATDDNYIVAYDLDNSAGYQPRDSIAMGTKVTAMDFDDNNNIIFFGTVSGDIGFIKYDGDRKNQPVYDIENALGSRITGMDLFAVTDPFDYKRHIFLLATGLNSKAAVYKIDSNLLVPGNKFSANILPDQELGQIRQAAFDTSLKQVVLETFKANTRTVYMWDPFTDSALLKYKEFTESFYRKTYGPVYKTIWRDTKFY